MLQRILSLVNHMLALHEQRQAARTALDTRILTNQIEATDRRNDRLVYELYGLTGDEVRIIEPPAIGEATCGCGCGVRRTRPAWRVRSDGRTASHADQTHQQDPDGQQIAGQPDV